MTRIALHSSLLRAATYQAPLAQLDLEFVSGAVYRYLSVPAHIYQDLLQAESHGRYFNCHIRNRFACIKIHPAEPTRLAILMPSS